MSKVTIVSVNDKKLRVVTVAGLATYCGKAPRTIRLYEQSGIIPEANIRGPEKKANGKVIPGIRLYTTELALEVGKIFKTKIKQGIATTPDVLQEIIMAFEHERQRINQP